MNLSHVLKYAAQGFLRLYQTTKCVRLKTAKHFFDIVLSGLSPGNQCSHQRVGSLLRCCFVEARRVDSSCVVSSAGEVEHQSCAPFRERPRFEVALRDIHYNSKETIYNYYYKHKNTENTTQISKWREGGIKKTSIYIQLILIHKLSPFLGPDVGQPFFFDCSRCSWTVAEATELAVPKLFRRRGTAFLANGRTCPSPVSLVGDAVLLVLTFLFYPVALRCPRNGFPDWDVLGS